MDIIRIVAKKQATDGFAIASHRDRERGGAESLYLKNTQNNMQSQMNSS